MISGTIFSTVLAPILLTGFVLIVALSIGLHRKIAWLSAVSGVALVLGSIFVIMALPARLRAEKTFAHLDQLSKAYGTSYVEFSQLSQRKTGVTNKEKREFIENQLIPPINEGLEEISSRSVNKILKQSLASRASLFSLQRAGCDFLLLNLSLADEVQELESKLRSGTLPPASVSNAIVSRLLPALKSGIERVPLEIRLDDLDAPTRARILAQSQAFERRWSRRLGFSILALENQVIHASLMADLRRFFQLRNHSGDSAHHEAGAFLAVEFSTHLRQTNERWVVMREYLKAFDKGEVASLQHQLLSYQAIQELLASEDREFQLNTAFENLVEGWQRKHWSQSQALSFAEREFHGLLDDRGQNGEDGLNRSVATQEKSATTASSEQHGDKSSEKLIHDLRSKVQALKTNRAQLIERLLADLRKPNRDRSRDHSQDLTFEMNEWNEISHSPLKTSMLRSVGNLEQAATSGSN